MKQAFTLFQFHFERNNNLSWLYTASQIRETYKTLMYLCMYILCCTSAPYMVSDKSTCFSPSSQLNGMCISVATKGEWSGVSPSSPLAPRFNRIHLCCCSFGYNDVVMLIIKYTLIIYPFSIKPHWTTTASTAGYDDEMMKLMRFYKYVLCNHLQWEQRGKDEEMTRKGRQKGPQKLRNMKW